MNLIHIVAATYHPAIEKKSSATWLCASIAVIVCALAFVGSTRSANAQLGTACTAAQRDNLTVPGAHDAYIACSTAFLACSFSTSNYSGTDKYNLAISKCMDEAARQATRGGRTSSDPGTRYLYSVLHPPVYTPHDEVAGLDAGSIFKPVDRLTVTIDNDMKLSLNPLRKETTVTVTKGDVLLVSEIYPGSSPNNGLWYHVPHGWVEALQPNAAPVRVTEISDRDAARLDDVKLKAFTKPIFRPYGKFYSWQPGPSVMRFACSVVPNPVSAERTHARLATILTKPDANDAFPTLPVGASITLDDQVYNNNYSNEYYHASYSADGGSHSGWIEISCIKPNVEQ